MRRTLLAALAVAGCGDNRAGISPDTAPPVDALPPPIATVCAPGDPFSVLVLTRQTYWNHSSNPIAAAAIQAMGAAAGWHVDVAGDPIVVTEDQLTRTDAIVFSVTSGDILDDDQRALLERFFRSGGGYAGTHSASFTEWDWKFYPQLVPVLFKTHPLAFQGTMTIQAPGDPILADLPDPWVHFDEYYTFDRHPEELGVHVLLALDEAVAPNYPPDVAMGYHPISWTYQHDGIRAFYTGLGHPDDAYGEPLFLETLQHGISWAGSARYQARCGRAAMP
jgi:type 1 glutamine amidotransferase